MPPDLVKDDLFNIVIQCGTVLAVLLVFATRVKQLLTSWRDPVTQDYLAKFSAAFLITAFGGLAMEKFHFKLPEHLAPIAWAMLIGGVLFVVNRTLVSRQTIQPEDHLADCLWGRSGAARRRRIPGGFAFRHDDPGRPGLRD
jgi:undecaprenyl-diphosphatase